MKKLMALPLLLLLALACASWAGVADLPQETTDPRQAFMAGAITVKGEGAAPDKMMSQAQKRIMALRAAKVVALREAAEILDGVSVTGDTTVMNAAAESDTVRTTVQGIVKGAMVLREVYDPLSGMAVVYVSVPMPGVAGSLLPQLSGFAPLLQPYAGAVQPQASHDGLIVDARGTEFKPALMNRITTAAGEVIYDPSRVAQNILVSRGAAEYTNDIGKARALLSQRGSVNPLVVKAGAVSRHTDVALAGQDASAVFASNQAGSYLEAAKVVFVLN